MDSLVESRREELSRVRQDYDELFEKFKLANTLFADREALYRNQIQQLEESMAILRRKNDNLKFSLKAQNAAKEAFTEDVLQLQEVAKLLEEREQTMVAACDSANEKNKQLEKENESLRSTVVSLQDQISRLQVIMEDTTVSKIEYNALNAQLKTIEGVLQTDYVSKTLFNQQHDDLVAIKSHMENDTVEKALFDALQSKLQQLEQRLPTDFIAMSEYKALQHILQNVLDERKLWEESSRVVEESRGEKARLLSEAEARIISLKDRVEHSEIELSELRGQYQQVTDELFSARAELDRREKEQTDQTNTISQLEQARASLLTQVGHLKLTLRNEAEARHEAIEAKAALQLQVEKLRREFSTSLIDSNQKIKQVFDSTEDQLRRRLDEHEQRIQYLQEQLETANKIKEGLESNYEAAKEHNRDMEVLITDAKTQLTIQIASNDTFQRENFDLRQQIVDLKMEREMLLQKITEVQRQNKELNENLEEFRLMVFSELSPSFKKFLGPNGHGNGQHSLPSSVASTPLAVRLGAPPPGNFLFSPTVQTGPHSQRTQPMMDNTMPASTGAVTASAAGTIAEDSTYYTNHLHQLLQPPTPPFMGVVHNNTGLNDGQMTSASKTDTKSGRDSKHFFPPESNLPVPSTPAVASTVPAVMHVNANTLASSSRPATPISSPALLRHYKAGSNHRNSPSNDNLPPAHNSGSKPQQHSNAELSTAILPLQVQVVDESVRVLHRLNSKDNFLVTPNPKANYKPAPTAPTTLSTSSPNHVRATPPVPSVRSSPADAVRQVDVEPSVVSFVKPSIASPHSSSMSGGVKSLQTQPNRLGGGAQRLSPQTLVQQQHHLQPQPSPGATGRRSPLLFQSLPQQQQSSAQLQNQHEQQRPSTPTRRFVSSLSSDSLLPPTPSLSTSAHRQQQLRRRLAPAGSEDDDEDEEVYEVTLDDSLYMRNHHLVEAYVAGLRTPISSNNSASSRTPNGGTFISQMEV